MIKKVTYGSADIFPTSTYVMSTDPDVAEIANPLHGDTAIAITSGSVFKYDGGSKYWYPWGCCSGGGSGGTGGDGTTSIQVNGMLFNPVNGTITLPDYPTEAPSDGKIYVRQDGDWIEISDAYGTTASELLSSDLGNTLTIGSDGKLFIPEVGIVFAIEGGSSPIMPLSMGISPASATTNSIVVDGKTFAGGGTSTNPLRVRVSDQEGNLLTVTANGLFISASDVDTGTQIQSDWLQEDNTSVDYIKNKPDILSLVEDNLANLDLISQINYDEQSGDLTFTYTDGTIFSVNLLLGSIVSGLDYDPVTQELIIIKENNEEVRIDVAALLTIYSGGVTDQIVVNISPENVISATLLPGSITKNELAPELVEQLEDQISLNQGEENAGLFLGIDEDGQVIPMELPSLMSSVKTDDVSIVGNGTLNDPLSVQISQEQDNGLSLNQDGLYVDLSDYIGEAPIDDKRYIRKNENWEELGEPETQVQSNWDETDDTNISYIRNKPDVPALIALHNVSINAHNDIRELISNLDFIANVEYNDQSSVLTFTFKDNTKLSLNLLTSELINNLEFDSDTNEMVITKENGEEIRIDISSFSEFYQVSTTDTIKMSMDNNRIISADIVPGSITQEMLSENIMEEIFTPLYVDKTIVGDGKEISPLGVQISNQTDNALQILPDGIYNPIVDISDKVDKIAGKGLSTNDLTDELKTQFINKLDDAPMDNNQYVREDGSWVAVNIPDEQIQSDWAQTNTEMPNYIQNKPNISEIINNHNESETAHNDIRQLITNLDFVKDVQYNSEDGILTFTYKDNSILSINILLEELVQGIDYDSDTQELVITKQDGTETRINISNLIDIYVGSDGDHIQITIDSSNNIHAILKSGTISEIELHSSLIDKINSKLDEIIVDEETIIGNGSTAALSVQISEVPNNIIETKTDGLYVPYTDISGKVDKVEGKGLSDNNLTNELISEFREKLDDAPGDNNLYARKNENWEQIIIPDSQIPSDWEQVNPLSSDYIKNKPNIDEMIDEHNVSSIAHSDIRTIISDLQFIQNVEYLQEDETLLFTFRDDSQLSVNLAFEDIISGMYYDSDTGELVIERQDEPEIRIDISSLIKTYVGGDTSTIQVAISGSNVITASILPGSIASTMLSPELKEQIADPIYTDNTTIVGNGSSTNPLSVNIDDDLGNAIVFSENGLFAPKIDTNNFVEKIVGKGLSTNDLTNELLEYFSEKLDDAPNDDKQYIRINGEWVEVTIPNTQIQSDWAQDNILQLDFIKNKPDIDGMINVHNESSVSHGDIRNSISSLEFVKNIVYNEENGTITFTMRDGTETIVSLLSSEVISGITYDSENGELVIAKEDGEIRIPVSDLIAIYNGSNGNHIQISIGTDNVINAILKSGTVSETELTIPLAEKINNKLDNVLTDEQTIDGNGNTVPIHVKISSEEKNIVQTKSDGLYVEEIDVSNKVDKVIGKGLSTNDLTDELVEYFSEKLDDAPYDDKIYGRLNENWTELNIPNAQIPSDWNQSNSGSLDYIKNKPNIAALISDHNIDENSHGDIRQIFSDLEFVKDVTYSSITGNLTFIYKDDSTLSVNVYLNNLIQSISYNSTEKKLIATKHDNSEISVDLSELMNVYTGSDSSTIALEVQANNVINAFVKAGSITEAQLSTTLLDKIYDTVKVDGMSISGGGTVENPLSVKISELTGNKVVVHGDGIFVPETDISEKVDKVIGMGLSHNDLTDELKNTFLSKIDEAPEDGNSYSRKDGDWEKIIIPNPQIQSDWNQVEASSVDYIKNKPNIDTMIENHNISSTSHSDIRDEILNLDYISDVSYDNESGILLFTFKDNTTLSVDIVADSVIEGIDFDSNTNELVLIKQDGTEVRVDISTLINVYDGSIGNHIQITIDSSNNIHAILRAGTVSETELTSEVVSKLNSKPIVNSQTMTGEGTIELPLSVKISSTVDNAIYVDANGIFVPSIDIDGKLDKNQGVNNSGKHMVVNSSGNIVPTTLEPQEIFIDNRTLIGDGITDPLEVQISSYAGNSLTSRIDGIYAPYTDISGKVDKISGKGLSSNDLTDELKATLLAKTNEAPIDDEAYLRKNGEWVELSDMHTQVQSNWMQTDNTEPDYILNKPDVPSLIASHNVSDIAHNDIRTLISNLEFVKEVVYNEEIGELTFTNRDNVTFTVGLNVSDIIQNIYYNKETNNLVIVGKDGSEIPIDMSELSPTLTGSITETIQVIINEDNSIGANLLPGSITSELLSDLLKEKISNIENVVDEAPSDGQAYTRKDGQWVGLSDYQIQSDWNEDNDNLASYIFNKPNISALINSHNISGTAHTDIRQLFENLEFVKKVEYSETTGDLTFTLRDNSTVTINLLFEDFIKNLNYDSITKELVITKNDDTEVRVNIADLIDIYVGHNGTHIQTSIGAGNTIQATLKSGSITENELSAALLNKINSSTNFVDYRTLIGEGSEADPYQVQISSNSGNALQSKINGLFVQEVDLTTKVDKNQGIMAAGRYLGVNITGQVEPMQVSQAATLTDGQTIHGDGSAIDPLGVQVSQDSGNSLAIRPNGLFVPPSTQVQSNWTESSAVSPSYIQNKPDLNAIINAHNLSGSSHTDIRNLINSLDYVSSVDYSPATGDITFIYKDGSSLTINILIASLVKDLDYDPITKELILTRANDTMVRIDISDLITLYSGSTGSHIQVTIGSGNSINATLRAGTIGETALTSALIEKINTKTVTDGETIVGQGTTESPIEVQISSNEGNILTSESNGLFATVNTDSFVEKIPGKGLSTVDVTVPMMQSWNDKLNDAPSDGNQYVRQDGEWEQVAIPDSQIQVDWTEENISLPSFIKNKPNIDEIINEHNINLQAHADIRNEIDDVNIELTKKIDKTTSPEKIYGTDNEGLQITYDLSELGAVKDVQVDGLSVVNDNIANITDKLSVAPEDGKIYAVQGRTFQEIDVEKQFITLFKEEIPFSYSSGVITIDEQEFNSKTSFIIEHQGAMVEFFKGVNINAQASIGADGKFYRFVFDQIARTVTISEIVYILETVDGNDDETILVPKFRTIGN